MATLLIHELPPSVLLPLRRAALGAVAALLLALLNAQWRALAPCAALEEVRAIATTVLVLVLALRATVALQRAPQAHEAHALLLQTAKSLVLAALAGGDTTAGSHAAFAELLANLKRFALTFVLLVSSTTPPPEVNINIQAALHDLLDAHEVAALAGVATANPRRKTASPSSIDSSEVRASLVELWLRRAVTRAFQRNVLSPHHAMELNRLVSSLPRQHARYSTRSPTRSLELYLRRHSRRFIYVFLVVYCIVRLPTSGLFTPLWVLVWGCIAFGFEAVAASVEASRSQAIGGTRTLLACQRELLVVLRSELEPLGAWESFVTNDRELAETSVSSTTQVLAMSSPPRALQVGRLGRKTQQPREAEMTELRKPVSSSTRDDEARPLLPLGTSSASYTTTNTHRGDCSRLRSHDCVV
ncbi:hypothetical protein PINS_up012680 [Pythium insidiosum]|nr:hypothetical protein PINS_up012680 [Pythium insidiosum]